MQDIYTCIDSDKVFDNNQYFILLKKNNQKLTMDAAELRGR